MLPDQLGEDVILEILTYLEAVSATRFLSISKNIWNLRTKPQFRVRIAPYQQLIKDQNWNEGLSISVQHINFPQIDYFIMKGATDWNSALIAAVQISHLKLVKFFTEKLADPMKGMDESIKFGNRLLVAYFVQKLEEDHLIKQKKVDPTHRHPIGLLFNRPMLTAAHVGHRDLVELFISKGANEWNQGLENAITGGHQEIVEFFISLKGGMDWNVALRIAVRAGQRNLVEFFVAKGANDFDSAAEMAMSCDNKQLVSYFLDKGADATKVARWNW